MKAGPGIVRSVLPGLCSRLLPFADAATGDLPLGRLLRLALSLEESDPGLMPADPGIVDRKPGGIDVDLVIGGQRHLDRHRALDVRQDRVQRIAGPEPREFVPFPAEGPDTKIENVVTPVAHDDLVGGEPGSRRPPG